MMKKQPVTETDLKAMVAREIRAARDHDDGHLRQRRADAINYYRGDMKDVPAEEGRSSVVSRDVADTIGWMLPGIIRVFTASDEMARYEPVEPSDEDFADQASAGANYVFWKDNDGYKVLYESTHDSLLLGNGIVKVWWDDTPQTKVSNHSGLSDDQLADLLSEDDVEVLAHSESAEAGEAQDVDPMTGEPISVTLHDVKIRRQDDSGRIRLISIAPEDFGMDGDADSIDEARFTFHREQTSRSDLIEMGFDRSKVETLALAREDDSQEAQAREEAWEPDSEADPSMQLVDLYECYMRTDVDGDGIAETVRIYYAGDSGGGEILDWEVWEDDLPFVDIPCAPLPHRWDAESVADETMDVQRVKTVLTRQALDNIYATNIPRMSAEEDSVLNPDELFSPKFGGVVWHKSGSNPPEPFTLPFVAANAFEAIEYQDQVIERRTGVSRSTMALDPEALQNQTATAAQNTRDAAYSQVELIARNQAELGWKKVFRSILRLMVKHQDRPRTIRLRDKFIEIDPRHWNADMDVTINIGLGTGSRDRDMSMLNNVLASQVMITDRLAQTGFAAQALEMLPMIRNTLVKIAESAGLKSPEQFYPEITDEDVAALQQQAEQMQQQGDPKAAAEAQKMQADMQMQAQKMQMDAQMQQAKMQAEMQRDQGRAELEREKISAQMEADRQRAEADIALKREQISAEMALKREQLAAELELKRELAYADLEVRRELGKAGLAAKASETGGSSPVRMGGDPG